MIFIHMDQYVVRKPTRHIMCPATRGPLSSTARASCGLNRRAGCSTGSSNTPSERALSEGCLPMSVATRYTLCMTIAECTGMRCCMCPVSALAVFAASSWYDGKTSSRTCSAFWPVLSDRGDQSHPRDAPDGLSPAPVAIETRPNAADLILKSGDIVRLRSSLKLYRDRSGRSFGLTGVSEQGTRRQFVFHRGQFKQDSDFQAVMNCYDPGQAGKA